MTLTLIFSVPLVHLSAALEGDPRKPIAFGTDVMETFTDGSDGQLLQAGLQVLIYASQPNTDPKNAKLFRAGAMVVGGEFVRWQRATKHGRHPAPERRPLTTDTDGPVCGFIEVANLHRLEPPIKIADGLRKVGGAKLSANYIPRRPLLVVSVAAA